MCPEVSRVVDHSNDQQTGGHFKVTTLGCVELFPSVCGYLLFLEGNQAKLAGL